MPTRFRRGADLDHLIGASEQRRRHLKPESPGTLEIDHRLVLGWDLRAEACWFLTPDYAVDAGIAPDIGL